MAISEEQRAERIKANAQKELDLLLTPKELDDEVLKGDIEKLATFELDELKAENESLDTAYKALESENDTLQDKVRTLEAGIERKDILIALAEEARNALEGKKEELEQVNLALLDEVEDLKKQVAELSAKAVSKKKAD